MRILALAVVLGGCHDWDSLSRGRADLTAGQPDLSTEEPDLSVPGEMGMPDLLDAAVPMDAEPPDLSVSATADLFMCLPHDLAFRPDGGAMSLSFTGGSVTVTGVTHLVAAADVGGAVNIPDGNVDLVALQHDDRRLTVLLSKGTGAFFAPLDSAMGGDEVHDFAIGDFDEDGKPDAMVTFPTLDQLGFMKGAGDGTFASPSPRPLEAVDLGVRTPRSLAAAFFDADRHLDLVVVEEDGQRVRLFLGLGDGTFREGGSQPITAGPHRVLAADLDGDCLTDVAVSNYDHANVSVFLGNGNGTLRIPAAPTHVVGGQPTQMATGDFNRDGLPDLVVDNSNNAFLSLLLGERPGLFAVDKHLNLADFPKGMTVGDINGDRALDIVVFIDNFSIVGLLGDGAGNFAGQTLLGGDAHVSLATADFNHDGLDDLGYVRANALELYHQLNTSN